MRAPANPQAPTTQMTPFVLCADDFAMTAGVSRGILSLAERGRVSAVGAMTTRPHWRILGPQLARFNSDVALGLHLNLTLGAPIGPMAALAPTGELPRLPRLARDAATGRVAVAELAGEIGRQIDAFADVVGRSPDFIDGHQHVHVLPRVRAALLGVVAERGLAGRLWLRDPADAAAAILRRGVATAKASVIALIATGFGAAAETAGFATNAGFAGVSPFDPRRDFGRDFARFLIAPGRRHLVMCHPGEVDAELGRIDEVIDTRPQELAFFLSDRFIDVCGEAGMRLAAAWKT